MDEDRDKIEGFLDILNMMKSANDKKVNDPRIRHPYEDMARTFKDTYDAFIKVGFTAEQSFDILLTILGGLRHQ